GRDYGNSGDYDCRFPGLNARMSELHAAVALASLSHLDEAVARRGELARQFAAETQGLPGLVPAAVAEGDTSTYKDLTVVVEPEQFGLGAAELGRALLAEGVDTRRYYYPPIHLQKAYADRWPRRRDLPVTEELSGKVLTLPLWSQMTPAEVSSLAGAVARIHQSAGEVRPAVA
ncbi:MAG: DegT/DnrJ/EryC1/StrS family aminotransferase, partial [Acidimicrobiales bacterium]